MQVTIIGLGLMGGSVARDLRRTGFATGLTGVESSPEHAARALADGLVDRVAPLEEALRQARLVVLAVPVDAIVRLLPPLLDRLPAAAVAVDLGSTKLAAVAAVRGHPRRGRYVALHPMAGTERSGPAAALERLFEGQTAIVCDAHDSDADATRLALDFVAALGMRAVHMEATFHDRHAACLSHMPHLVAYALALAALQQERDAGAMLDLAGGGFAAMVRVAQSAPSMWVPILLQNRAPVLDALALFAAQLERLRQALARHDAQALHDLIAAANKVRAALTGNGANATPPPG